ncbi:MAG: sugar MFS transporter [Acidobacteriaceae bacterium]|nr:sugar MFS transporter [Acidobacteriaceae bacterium]
MASSLFFMWGFLTCLNDILIPHLKNIFDLNYFGVMFVQFAFFSAYFVFGVPAGKLVEAIGYKRSMITGLLVMAVGALLFIPAANVPSYGLFLTAFVVLAAGITCLQVSANPFVSILGPPATAASRLNLAQAFNSVGTTVAPYIGGLLILSGAALSADEMHKLTPLALHAYRLHESATVKMPYVGIAVLLLALAVSLMLFRFPETTAPVSHSENTKSTDSIWRHRRLLMAIVGIFVYVGAEVSIGSFLINYFTQPDTGGLTVKIAATLVSVYWGGAMIGRFVGSVLLQKVDSAKLLAFAALVASVLVASSMLTYGHVAVATILAVGFFNSVMFPSIFTLGIAGLGPLTGRGSGLLIAAIVGGAIIPVAQGKIADHIGIHHAFFLPVVCYLYIALFGVMSRGTDRMVSAVPVED